MRDQFISTSFREAVDHRECASRETELMLRALDDLRMIKPSQPTDEVLAAARNQGSQMI